MQTLEAQGKEGGTETVCKRENNRARQKEIVCRCRRESETVSKKKREERQWARERKREGWMLN